MILKKVIQCDFEVNSIEIGKAFSVLDAYLKLIKFMV